MYKAGLNKCWFYPPLLVLALLSGCTIEKPESPTWELDLVVPLIDQKYYLRDLEGPIAGDSTTYIDIWEVDSTMAMRLNVEDTIGTVTLDESKLNISGFRPSPITQVIGIIELSDFGSGETTESTPLSGLSPEVASAPDGTVIPVPPFTLEPFGDSLRLENIKEAVMASGSIRISIYNGFIDGLGGGVPITNLVININDSLGIEIGRAVYERIGPDTTEARIINLAGKRVTNPMVSETSANSPGVSSLNINSTSKSGRLRITTEFIPPFQVSSATAVIPQQTFGETGSTPLSLSGSTELISGIFKSDTKDMLFTINNQLQLPLRASLVLPNFIDSTSGLPEQVTWDSIPAGITEIKAIQIAGDTLKNPSGNDPLTEIEFQFSGATLQQGGFSTVAENDFISVQFDVDTLKFKQIKAIFHETVPTTDVTIDDMPEGFEGIFLADVQLIMNIVNSIRVPTFLDLDVTGVNTVFNRTASIALRDAQIKSPQSTDGVDTTVIIFKKDSTCVDNICEPAPDTDIVDFFNILPDSIIVSGQATLFGEGIVEVGKSVGGWFELKVPFSLSLAENSKFLPSLITEVAALSEDNAELVENNLIFAIVESELRNNMPLSGSISILLTDDSTKFSAHPDSLEVDTLFTTALPLTDPMAGITNTTRNDTINLDSSKIRLFARGGKQYIKPLIILFSTEGEPRTIAPDDFIGIKSMVTFRVKIDP